MHDNYSAASGQGVNAGRYSNTPLTDFIEAMPSNSWAQYTGTNINEMSPRDFDGTLMGVLESEANKPFTNWCNKFCYDPASRAIIGVGTAEGYISFDGGENYSKCIDFKLHSNSFTVKWNPTGLREGHCYDSNCSVPVNGWIYRKSYGVTQNISRRLASGGNWEPTTYNVSGLSTLRSFYSLESFPELGDSGSVLLLENLGRLIRFDIATGLRSVVGTFSGIGNYPVMVYVNGALIFGAGNGGTSIYRMEASGAVNLITASIPVTVSSESYAKMIASPLNEDKAYIFTNQDGLIRTIDTLNGSISSVGTYISDLATRVTVAAASITATEGIVFLDGRGRSGGVTQSKFWVYKV